MSARPLRQSHRRGACTLRSAYWMTPICGSRTLHTPPDSEASGGSTMRFSRLTQGRRVNFAKDSASAVRRVRAAPQLHYGWPTGLPTIGNTFTAFSPRAQSAGLKPCLPKATRAQPRHQAAMPCCRSGLWRVPTPWRFGFRERCPPNCRRYLHRCGACSTLPPILRGSRPLCAATGCFGHSSPVGPGYEFRVPGMRSSAACVQ